MQEESNTKNLSNRLNYTWSFTLDMCKNFFQTVCRKCSCRWSVPSQASFTLFHAAVHFDTSTQMWIFWYTNLCWLNVECRTRLLLHVNMYMYIRSFQFGNKLPWIVGSTLGSPTRAANFAISFMAMPQKKGRATWRSIYNSIITLKYI